MDGTARTLHMCHMGDTMCSLSAPAGGLGGPWLALGVGHLLQSRDGSGHSISAQVRPGTPAGGGIIVHGGDS